MADQTKVATVVVDDNFDDRYTVRRYLSRREEFGELLEAEDGSEFIEKICDTQQLAGLATGKPVLILMDINMPTMGGFETAVALQERVQAGTVPSSLVVMMFTSSENPEDRRRAEELDIVKGYIVKPLDDNDIDELLQLYAG